MTLTDALLNLFHDSVIYRNSLFAMTLNVLAGLRLLAMLWLYLSSTYAQKNTHTMASFVNGH